MPELGKVYDPSTFEARWYEHWEKNGRFAPQPARNGETYTIVIPPPNVTGVLHIGHVLNNTIQDVLIRTRRLQGYRTLWLPGMDHAGIATQNVVKTDLEAKGTSMTELGREKFVETVWEWKKQYGGRIIRQLRTLGCSCDWERERFTLDEGLSRAVETAFCQLYRKGWIYRGLYLVNWCIGCQTAISDEEVEYEERHDYLYYVKYPIKGTDRSVTVATTRPETILADTAVAVHPEDERYRQFLGMTLILPILHREIPLVADDAVQKDFGTGALKVTPGHDPVDFAIGKRHNLPVLSGIDRKGFMTEIAGPFAGMDRDEARRAVVRQLESDGLLEKKEPYTHSVGQCHRCNTVIEPFLSQQWFVRMQELAAPAIDAARREEVRFIPQRWEKVYLHWLENIRDWCISRQLWWGHSIPISYCSQGHEVLQADLRGDPTPADLGSSSDASSAADSGPGSVAGSESGSESSSEPEPVSASEPRGTCPVCGSTQFTPDPDVLDTWFSSWLWPFSTLGWPEKTKDLSEFYPTNDLVTGPDIIFFWVARMVMAGYEFMGEKPFSQVHLHGIVRDELGRKMSKSLGNSPDPIDLIEKYGADALRFTMLMLTPTGTDVLFGEKKIETGRNFANKLWNATRFALMNLGDIEAPAAVVLESRELSDRWLVSRLHHVTREVERQVDEMRFNDVARVLYEFVWHEYCDWYLEMAKVRIQAGGEDAAAARSGILLGLTTICKLLHPLMPFITEEIWHHLPGTKGDLITAEWPDAATLRVDDTAEEAMGLLMETVVAVRNLRSEMNVSPAREAAVSIRAGEHAALLYEETAPSLRALARVSELHIGPDLEKPRHAASDVVRSSEIFVHLEGLIDIELERGRLTRELERTEKLVISGRKKLENQDFLEKAKPDVVEKEREKLAHLEQALSKLQRALQILEN